MQSRIETRKPGTFYVEERDGRVRRLFRLDAEAYRQALLSIAKGLSPNLDGAGACLIATAQAAPDGWHITNAEGDGVVWQMES